MNNIMVKRVSILTGIILLILTILLPLFYSMTAIVYDEGDFGIHFVIKPYPMSEIVFGGGEEGSWKRDNPNEPLPWFLTYNYTAICHDDWEGDEPICSTIYIKGYSIIKDSGLFYMDYFLD